MADVRCPLCGKQNPAENETCQYCQARLKPLRIKSDADRDAAPPGAGPPGVPARGEADEMGGWLNSLRGGGTTSHGGGEDELPDWLRSDEPVEGDDQPFGDTQGGLPDWLIGSSEEVSSKAKPVSEENLDGGWLRMQGDSEDRPQGAFGDPSVDQSPFESSDDLPDWLFEKAAPAETADVGAQWEEETGGTPDLAGELPDWLSASGQPVSTGKGNDDLPDWLILKDQDDELSPLMPETDIPGSAPEANSGQAEAQGSVEWWPSFSAVEEGNQPFDIESTRSVEGVLGAGILYGIETSGASQTGDQGGSLPERPGSVDSGGELQPDDGEGLPDWLSSPGETGQNASLPEWISGMEAGAGEPADQEGLPDWLTGAEIIGGAAVVSALGAERDEAGEILSDAELPDWLRGDVPLSEEQSVAPVATGGEPDLAELPPWLSSIRTVAALELINLGQDADAPVENIGPLRGFKGILPVEPDIARGQKMTPAATKKKPPEYQDEHAALFAELIRTEGQAQPLEKKAGAAGKSVLRGLVGLVMVVAVLVPLLVHYPKFNPPQVEQAATAVNQLVSAMPAGLPVLVAVDYPASAAGELDIAARPVIQQLLNKGAFLAFVSTIPTGPAQAEYLASISAASDQVAQQTLNLGYIPGGPPGLLGFAETPQQVLPFALDGRYAWEVPQLSGMNSLGNFGMLLVLTDNPDASRAWIEQVRPLLGLVPMVFITSAQIEPIVQPYFGVYPMPVQGIISGVPGGVAYESLAFADGANQKYWASFSLGGLVAVILILVGGLMSNAVPSGDARRTPTGREKKTA